MRKTDVVQTPILIALVCCHVAWAADGVSRTKPAAVGKAALGSAEFQPTPQRPIGWRGDGSGRYAAANPVRQWSEKKNVLWATDVGVGQSSPVLAGTRVLITAEPNLLVCLDSASGKELWCKSHKLSELPAELNAKGLEPTSQYGDATPCAVSDGKSVWIFLGTGVVACYDLDGSRRWVNWLDLRRTTGYGRTASPVLVGDHLLVHFGPLICFDAATGKVLWKNDRAKASYGTPAPARIADVDVVITPKGNVVRVADGEILAADLATCGYTSPIVDGRVVYFIDRDMTAVELPEKAGDQIQCKELWSEEQPGEFYASPLLHEGRIYAVDRFANYFVINAASGKTVLTKTLELPPAGHTDGPSVYPSICLAGKHLFVSNDAGETVLLEPSDKSPAVASNKLRDGSGGSPVFSGKRMYIRGGKRLYCIGE